MGIYTNNEKLTEILTKVNLLPEPDDSSSPTCVISIPNNYVRSIQYVGVENNSLTNMYEEYFGANETRSIECVKNTIVIIMKEDYQKITISGNATLISSPYIPNDYGNYFNESSVEFVVNGNCTIEVTY